MPDYRQQSIFAGLAEDHFLPARHPLRRIRAASDTVLAKLLEQGVLIGNGRDGAVPAEQALRALALWVLCGTPSERRLIDDLRYNLLHRWFVGLDVSAQPWNRTAFRAARRRLVTSGLAGEFLARTFKACPGRGGIAHPYFSVNRDLFELLSGQQFLAGLRPSPRLGS